ncbi:30S ribosomal protein S12 methylthiotransferase RimO [Acetobacterium carbinolicum]|jgi:MiaB-like tRNA modifying enzyme YliG, TIGR01125|uniref:30S ribosomal protein S12 methylthiotransferase RimO n=1 Tax=Acetobacterium TaxID=33951 RepID=UPI000DBEB1B0|nr:MULTISPECIES: 30S ribosomal protein S12 methylthiotransferase RimO [unclassified Acetobacterium]AWW25678.1 30S ribosomal protein S12 methylthiotransferase RimO [Acetobacterium sp. KB-1]MDK2941453.1 ribosomal protein methylthiotransferase [Acetobacterium sp.]MDZ5724634.1 30S ribosomal protein S12 methylthiotransferase RimO [Acetobacterium sp. K1/6]
MKTIHMTTLGCDKNTIDSEMMLGLIEEKKYSIVTDPKKAEIIIVNTCCFIQSAKEQSIDYILEYVDYKNSGLCQRLIVAGCMAERYHEELAAEIPEIDGFLGVGHFDNILELITYLEITSDPDYLDPIGNEEKRIETQFFGDIDKDIIEARRYIKEGTVSTFVRISEGCDHGCTYCVIPKIRGKYRSRRSLNIFEELQYLQERGIKEIILIGQDIAPYGKDLDEDLDLPNLLKKIASQFEFTWIRMMYLYPEGITDKLLAVVKQHPSISPYFDIPLQHLNDMVLKRMGRKMTFEQTADLISKIRKTLPEAVVRTSIITGFPGETSEQHAELINKIKMLPFDHLGVFKYSQEENTPAAKFENQIPEDEKEKRYNEIMITQQSISHAQKQRFIGKILKVLIEGVDEDTYFGRFYGDAPEIDGTVFVDSHNTPLTIGNFYSVKIVNALEYDLIGDIENEFTK